MNCPECGKIVPITKVVKPTDDALSCVYCHHVIPSESITWSDGKFHFIILGDVKNPKCPVSPRILMKEQIISVLDIKKIRATAIKIINREPNLRCICSEFFIQDSDIRVEILLENQEVLMNFTLLL